MAPRIDQIINSGGTLDADPVQQRQAARTIAAMLYPDREGIRDVLEAVGILPYTPGTPAYERTRG